MANPNPSPAHRFTKDYQPATSESRRKGGIASQKVLKEKKRTAEIISTFFSMKPEQLGMDISDIPVELRDKITVQDLIVYRQLHKAADMDADLGSFNAILDRCEGKPVQTIQASVESVSTDDISLDEALAIADTLSPEKSVKSNGKRTSRAKSE